MMLRLEVNANARINYISINPLMMLIIEFVVG